ncbi:MAG: hypothetical protein CVT65_08595 [Actinobacteria bacterium HGW-Actinobacteria-5]|nr:MAG: hypothetical protein CVT65_08595 [Actinobacteria bacterium HGW-Actinobacteria-5]
MFADLLERFRVASDARIGTLSRGEGTKLSLALALARRPGLLILDEPTSGLDPSARRDVIDVFAEFMAADEGHTILFSTHITSDLDRIADHLRVLAGGVPRRRHGFRRAVRARLRAGLPAAGPDHG